MREGYMSAKQASHESVKLELWATFREKLGSDVLDASTIHHTLADHIRKDIKVADASKLPNRFWGRILFVTNVLQQTVRLEGKGRFDIPDIDAPTEDITDFYEFMMARDEETIEFFREGLRKFDAVPLATGGKDEAASKNGSVESQTKETMNPIPA
jgi:hypothetical protein